MLGHGCGRHRDVGAGPGLGFLPLLSLGPALAAVWLRPRGTALVGALAVVTCMPLALYDGVFGSRRTAIAVAAVIGVTAAGAAGSAGRRRRERDLAEVKAVAGAMQRVQLRPVPARLGTVDIAVRYTSASTSAQIGGDLYEIIKTDRRIRLIIADVQGQGLAAVGTAARVPLLAAFGEFARLNGARSLADLPGHVDAFVARRAREASIIATTSTRPLRHQSSARTAGVWHLETHGRAHTAELLEGLEVIPA